MRHSEIRHNRKSLRQKEDAELTPRMFSSHLIPSVGFDPCPEPISDNNGIFGKMTSKVGGFLKGFKNAVGSIGDILKAKDEENIFTGSVSPSKIELSIRDVNSLPIQNHAISKMNFNGLSHILQEEFVYFNPNKKCLDKPPTTIINMSFGGSNTSLGNPDPLNQSTFSFQSQSGSNSKSSLFI